MSSLTREQWARVEALFDEARQQPVAARDAWLRAQEPDADTLALLLGMLESYEQEPGFLEAGGDVVAAVGEVLAEGVVGQRLGVYQIVRQVGHGGMGVVYEGARTDDFTRRVAVKMLRRGMDTEQLIRRFRHERQILASLDHPNIAGLFDGGSTRDGLPYFVMEFVDGVPIDRHADAHRLSIPDRLRLCLRVVDAVQYAHERQIVHRDLKPSNVLVTKEGHPKLLDFGIAKLLDDGASGASTLTAHSPALTPDYTTPEQVRGDAVTPATDVYALGLLLYELVSGHRAYRLSSRTPAEIARVICDEDPPRPSVAVTRTDTVTRSDGSTIAVTPEAVAAAREATPDGLRAVLTGGLDAIVLRALRKDPRYRYQTVRALGDDLRRYLDHEPIAATTGSWGYRLRRTATRHRLALAAAALVMTSVGATLWWRPAAPPAATSASPEATDPSPVTAPRQSVAVAGFRNLSGQAADDWLATALSEMLTTELSGGGQLRVVPAALVDRAWRDVASASTSALADPTALAAIKRAVGADYLVTGAFAVSPGATAKAIRIDVRVVGGTETPAALAQSGADTDLFALVTATGRALRERLGVAEQSAAEASRIRAALPASIEAARLYAEGLASLRSLDSINARATLERAAAIEPANPMIHLALASTWTALGYEARAVAAAEKAFELSKGLTREDRLVIEGTLRDARKQWPAAIEVYKTLWQFFSDNVEYGLRLAAAQNASGLGKDALTTVEAMRRLPAPANADPRIDLAESQAASDIGDVVREQAAIERAATRASEIGSTQLFARIRLSEGRSLYLRGRHPEARRAMEAARTAYERVADRFGVASALNSLGVLTDEVGDLNEADRLYRQALAIAESVGERRVMSLALNNLGVTLRNQGRLDEARAVHERALALRREIGDRNLEARSLNNIGVLLFALDRYQEAGKYYADALTLSRELGDRRNVARTLHNLATVYHALGDLTAARKTLEEIAAGHEANSDRPGRIGVRLDLGATLLALGEFEGARRIFEESLAESREIGQSASEGEALQQLGDVALAQDDLAEARRQHEAGLAVREQRREAAAVVDSRISLAFLATEEGKTDDAVRLAGAAAEAARERPGTRSRALIALAQARLAAGDVTRARQALAQARQSAKTSEYLASRWALDTTEARIELAAGRIDAARARLEPAAALVAPTSLVMVKLETRLLSAEIRGPGDADARRDLDAVIAEAKTRGANLLLRHAISLRRRWERPAAPPIASANAARHGLSAE